ncbi:MAG: glutamate--tRNA ligase, partial [Alphaproteobacteria bacterium]
MGEDRHAGHEAGRKEGGSPTSPVPQEPVVVRFAPSPTGHLHLGNVRAAVLNWLFARRHGGRFILRFDDTDPGRVREEYVTAIREDLAWLGLDWDEEIRQSSRIDRYRAAAERLKEAGRLYPCYETPEELALKRRVQRMRGRPPVYDRTALGLSEEERARLEAEGRRPHWRFLLATDAAVEWEDLIRGHQRIDPASLSDPVLIRADGSFLYLLPSVVDDIDLGVTHVIRGEDHVTNTAEQIQLITALGGKLPAFAHFPLMLGPDGRPLSKRAGDISLRRLREEGVLPLAVLALLATLGTGRAPESVTSREELIADFDIGAFSKAAVRF